MIFLIQMNMKNLEDSLEPRGGFFALLLDMLLVPVCFMIDKIEAKYFNANPRS